MRRGGEDRPLLTEMIRQSPAGETFLIPSQLLIPTVAGGFTTGFSLRTLFGILWISSESMRSGVRARFRASLTEVRIACGYESYGKDHPVLGEIDALARGMCKLDDTRSVPVFHHIGVLDEDTRVLEWVFTTEFIELFASPPQFAVVSIKDVGKLRSSLDFLLYLQVRRIWKMRMKSVVLGLGDVAHAASPDSILTSKRILERVRRRIPKLESIVGGDIRIHPMRQPGDRRYCQMRLAVEPRAS